MFTWQPYLHVGFTLIGGHFTSLAKQQSDNIFPKPNGNWSNTALEYVHMEVWYGLCDILSSDFPVFYVFFPFPNASVWSFLGLHGLDCCYVREKELFILVSPIKCPN